MGTGPPRWARQRSRWCRVLVLVQLALLSLYGARDLRVLGTGTGELRRAANATLRTFGVLALTAGALGQLDASGRSCWSRCPPGSLVVRTRWQWRRWLVRQRRTGRSSSTVVVVVVVVGGHGSAVVMARTSAEDPAAGFRVVGACVPGHGRGGRRAPRTGSWDDDHPVQVLEDESTVAAATELTSPRPLTCRAEQIGNEAAGPLLKIRGHPRRRVHAQVLRRRAAAAGQRAAGGDDHRGAHRPLLVRPGITGLWPVRGRSDLSWDGSVRLDPSHVENSSMTTDVAIVARTLPAVLAPDGA